MNCPSCSVGLKIASHRGLSVSYCPLCGGTWLDRGGFDSLPSVARAMAHRRRPLSRLLRIAILTALILAGCLIATISVGAVKLWPTVRGWAEALVTGKQAAVTALLGNSRLQPLLSSVRAVPELRPLIQDGTYLKVLQEAERQRSQSLLDLKPAEIVSADVRSAAQRIQQLIRDVPGAEVIGRVDPALVALLSSDAFKRLCGSGFFESGVGQGGPEGR